MNKKRRLWLQAVIDRLTEQKDELRQILDEEQEYYDNMPESFQEGEKGEKAQEAIDGIDDVICTLDDVMDSIEEIINAWGDAMTVTVEMSAEEFTEFLTFRKTKTVQNEK